MLGESAAKAAMDKIEREGITDPAEKAKVHAKTLGTAVAVSAVASVALVPALVGYGIYKGVKSLFS